MSSVLFLLYDTKALPKEMLHTFGVFIKDILHILDLKVNGATGAVTHSSMSIMLYVLTAAQ